MEEMKKATYHGIDKKVVIIDELEQLEVRLKGVENILLIAGATEETVDYNVLLFLVADVIQQLEERVEQIKNHILESE